ncbi:MAG: COX15/CtaA family protein [Pseudomonadota bacterium]
MNVSNSRITLLQKISLICALFVIIIVGISAFIRLSGAGLGCSPWPQCYGHISRAEQHGILQTTSTLAAPNQTVESQSADMISMARMAHRIFAVLLLPLIIVLVMSAFTMKPEPWKDRWLAVVALTLVLFLAVLGRWTAGGKVPAVVLGNLLSGFILFALCWRMARVGHHAPGRPARPTLPPAARLSIRIAIAVVLMQIILGGLVSGGFAGLSCPTLANCSLPEAIQWEVLNPMRVANVDAANWPANFDGVLTHSLHRWVALATALMVCVASVSLWRCGRRRTALALVLLVAFQIALGLLLVNSGLSLALAVLHNLLAASLLASLFSAD